MRIRFLALITATMLLLGGIAAQAEQSVTISDADAAMVAYGMLVGLADPSDYLGKTDPNSQLVLTHYHYLGVHTFNDIYTNQMRSRGLTPYTEENVPALGGSPAPKLGDSSIHLSALIAAAGLALCGIVFARTKYART